MRSRRWSILITSITLILAGCGDKSMSALNPTGAVGKKQLDLIYLSSGIMTFVTVIVAVLYIYVVIRYREKPGQDHIPEQVEGNTKLEVTWTVIPIILLIILAVPTISTTFQISKRPETPDALRVNVTGYQYWWKFDYPEQNIQTANEVHVPVGTKVEFTMKAYDVIHSFWAPSLGGKQDLNPGQENRLILQADRPGVYEGKCAELCGASHALMNFRVIVHPPDQFQKWVSMMKAPSSQPRTVQQEEGKKLVAQNCIGCHAIEGGNFRVKGHTGPDLTAFSERTRIAGVLDNNTKNLKEWLKDPQGIKPGNRMPAFDHLSDDQLHALVDYLQNLK
ncbi:cytochrome c oxidase subunit II [Kroppenstedtia pulmonis]|uniref:Cytochrome c oxidase subunit 2 n=1 Tax=Kroppenstedtia pulmonis TaxID=1380685 RepID=A0A7D4CK91_9BACL|nr:cytochrome c oxidase subunit II [Kroppenstedtia pulmonis]QKG83438.1 cytochrome c oxidase subunit II [Kroppenstedtia pulmonis]